jgi:hypothetical protein
VKIFTQDKKGVMFFTVDALMAGVIFTLTVVLLLSFILNTPKSIDAKYYIEGYISYVTSTSMKELSNNYKFVYYDPLEKNQDLMVYQKVLLMKNGAYSDEFITSFVENFTSFVVPAHVGVEYSIDGEVIYSRHTDRIDGASIYLSNSILTFAIDENNVMYGPNITKLTVWV